MSKQVQKADKLVTKATTVFGDAVVQVEKANELLRKGLEEDGFTIESAKKQIKELEDWIQKVEEDREEKSLKIVSNETLIEQLKTFVPQN